MKAIWRRQAQRIDALTLRERAIMFVSLACALVALADVLVLSPRMTEQRSLAAQLRQQATELEALRSTAAAAGGGASPAARLARQLRQLQAERQAVDAEIEHRMTGSDDPDGEPGARLQALLKRVLARNDGLTLVRLATATAPASGSAAASAVLPMRGVEIALRGPYAGLVRYVAATEVALPALRWGEVVITPSGSASTLTAQVFLIGEAR